METLTHGGERLGDRLPRLVAGRRSKWVVVLLALLVSGAALAFGGSPTVSGAPTAALPSGADSTQVTTLQERLPSADVDPALIVYSRPGGTLTDADVAAITARADAVTAAFPDAPVSPPVVADDRAAALVSVAFPAGLPSAELSSTVGQLRSDARADLPEGLQAQVTGSAAFTVDLGAVFEGADITLLAATSLVVALLLLVTYRSPWLWLVPLTVVGVGDQVAAKVVAVLTRTTGLTVDDSTIGITSVLVFGAGTNYALLLIARYREELRSTEDRHTAMQQALRSAGPAVLASSGTVFLALLTLSAAVTPSSRSIGLAGAAGIAVAVVYALIVLPAALVLFGRGLFWPFTPRLGQPDPTRSGPWARIGAAVVRYPRRVAVASVVVLGVLAAGTTAITSGLSLTEQFREPVESAQGLDTLAQGFPAGSADPAAVITTAATADQVVAAAQAVPGVSRASVAESDGEITQVDVVFDARPGTDESFATVEALRTAVAAVPGSDALVGGTEATELDARDAAARDRLVVIPLVLGVVLLVLLFLLRAVVASVLLILTVVASYAASMGASWVLFRTLFDFPALDAGVPLLAFLFLVALGVDYNIFLVTRAREEALLSGTRAGMVTAVAVTGGVITSAGVLLAAVFTVLGVLPLITLTQLGVIVGFGVLLDTLLVRSVLVPALVSMLGRRFWWPSALSRADEEPAPQPPVPESVRV